MKRLLQHASDPYMALLSFRATPLPCCMLSPAELLFGRKINTDLPQTDHCLTPQWTYLDKFRKADKEYKDKQQSQYNHRHRVRPLSVLPAGSQVWVKSGRNQIAGKIVSSAGAPRLYIVSTPSGWVRRNRHHLNIRRGELASDISLELETSTSTTGSPATPPSPPVVTRSPIMTRSQTGTATRPPQRFT